MTILRFILSAMLLSALTHPLTAHAACSPGIPCPDAGGGEEYEGTLTGEACDANFETQVLNRARLQSQMAQSVAQRLVAKPDSVLEYVCFDQMAQSVAEYAGPIFTETTAWRNRQVDLIGATTVMNTYMGPKKLDNSIEALVLTSVMEYANNNFAHEFLGGRSANDNSLSTSPSANYNCGHMNSIFMEARCANASSDIPDMTLSSLVNNDPRMLPEECGDTGITQEHVASAYNTDRVGIDDYNYDLSVCSAPIRTGLSFYRREVELIELGRLDHTDTTSYDVVCIEPGCYPNADGTACLR